MTQATIQDGRTVKVGDAVCFKSDVEQVGGIIGITSRNGKTWLRLEAPQGGFQGEYIRDAETTQETAEDCW